MMYLFHGTDAEKARRKAFEWVAKARAKEPNLAYVRLAREELTGAALEDITASGGLFVRRLLVLIDDPYAGARTKEDGEDTEEGKASAGVLDEHLDLLAASDNAIVILAPRLLAAKAKRLAGLAKVEYKFDTAVSGNVARGFNSALVDALASRSRERLFTEINRALAAGDAPEMLHGLLHWKARELMEKGGRAWSPREARALSLALIEILRTSRAGGLALPLALEKFALSV